MVHCSQRHYSSVQTELDWSLLRFRLDGTLDTEITVPFNFFKFSPTKDLAPFSIHTPQKPSFKPINYQFIVAGIC